MNCLFFVQGEGRGHLTQALALKEKLEQRQNHVVAIIVSSSKGVPDFFKTQISCPLFEISGPHFLVDKKNQGIKVFKSALFTIWHLPHYWQSIKKIRSLVIKYQPDILINFYEPLVSTYRRLYRDQRPMTCIGHQYFIHHPDSQTPKIGYVAKKAFYFYNWLTAGQTNQKIALSFTASPDLHQKNLFVCPPLIRSTIKTQLTTIQPLILIYFLNAGYSEEIIKWASLHPTQQIATFCNSATLTARQSSGGLHFYPLSGQTFINYLASCQTYVSTAGFDSIAEAAYFQKNIIMIPTKNHFEQKYNAIDAQRAGLAHWTSNFTEALKIIEQLKTPSVEAKQRFKEWVDNYDNKIVDLLTKQIS